MTDLAGVRAVRPDDPYLRWCADPSVMTEILAVDGHVAWIQPGLRGTEAWGTVMGEDPEVVVRLLRALDARQRLDGVTVLASMHGAVPRDMASHDAGGWSLWTLGEEGILVDPEGAIALEAGDPRIDEVLLHSSSSYLGADSPRVHLWSGVEAEGRLVAVAGLTREASGAAQLVSVCAVPEVRGQGLAGRACAHAVARVSPVPMVVLEMYTANGAAAALYRRLGFVERQRYVSGLIDDRRPD